MIDLRLGKKQRNALFKLIEDQSLDHSIFKLTENPPESEPGFKIALKEHEGEVYFKVGVEPRDAYQTVTALSIKHRPHEKWLNWDNVEKRFTRWLEIVAYELNTPDLWQSASLVAFQTKVPDSYEEKFSPHEARELGNRLDSIETFLIEQAESNTLRIEEIRKSIHHLKDRGEKLSKFDWQGIFVSTLISWTLDLSIQHRALIFAFCAKTLLPLLGVNPKIL